MREPVTGYRGWFVCDLSFLCEGRGWIGNDNLSAVMNLFVYNGAFSGYTKGSQHDGI